MLLQSIGGVLFSSSSITTQTIPTEPTTKEPLDTGSLKKHLTLMEQKSFSHIVISDVANIRMIEHQEMSYWYTTINDVNTDVYFSLKRSF